MRVSHFVLLAMLVASLAASAAIIEVRFEGRRLQAELTEAERAGAELGEYARRLRLAIATQTDLAALYLSAIDEHGLAVPSMSEGSLRYIGQPAPVLEVLP